MYDHTLGRRRKHFCWCCCLQIKMLKQSKYVKFKNFKRKIKSLCMVYANTESILVPEDNGSKILSLNKQISKTCCFQLWL